jgi:hypothetical protein
MSSLLDETHIEPPASGSMDNPEQRINWADRADQLKMELKDAGLWPGAEPVVTQWSQKCFGCGTMNRRIWNTTRKVPTHCDHCREPLTQPGAINWRLL